MPFWVRSTFLISIPRNCPVDLPPIEYGKGGDAHPIITDSKASKRPTDRLYIDAFALESKADAHLAVVSRADHHWSPPGYFLRPHRHCAVYIVLLRGSLLMTPNPPDMC